MGTEKQVVKEIIKIIKDYDVSDFMGLYDDAYVLMKESLTKKIEETFLFDVNDNLIKGEIINE